MRYLAGLILISLAAFLRFVWRLRAALCIAVAASFGMWYAGYINYPGARAILRCYFIIEVVKAFRGRG